MKNKIALKSLTSCLKLNSGGNGRPFGSLACGSRNSSKNEWAHASSWNSNSRSNELSEEERKIPLLYIYIHHIYIIPKLYAFTMIREGNMTRFAEW
jgi:hypothetical protein